MTKFRKRIGEKGAEKIFKISLIVNASEITEKELKQVMIDSAVQEKNITFPTDAKLYRKIIERLLKVSEREHIELRRTCTREVKALKLKARVIGGFEEVALNYENDEMGVIGFRRCGNRQVFY